MPPLPGVEFRGIGFSQPNTPRVPTDSIGSGLQQIGAAFKDVAGVLNEIEDEDGRIYAQKAISEIRLKRLKELQDAELSGNPLDGLTGRLSQGIEDDFAAYAEADPEGKAAPSRAGHYLELAKSDVLGDLSLSAQRLEGTDRVNRRIASIGETLRNAATAASTDPTLFPKLWAEGNALIDSTAMPFEAREKARGDLRGVAASAIAGMIERNPYAAAQQLESGAWDKYLDPNDRVSLYNGAQAGVRSREAEARARAAESRAAAAEAAGEYLAGADDYFAYRAAGNPPDAALEAKYSPEAIAALPIKNAGNLAKKAADALARGSVMLSLREDPSPENQARILKEVKDAADDPENFPFDQGTLQLVSSDIASFNEKLSKTPGDVAWQSRRVQDAIKSGDGVAIVSASLAEQERLEVPTWKRQPLAESYATSLAEQIAAMPPDQQAGAVQEMATSYGSYWPEVFKQVGPKLPSGLAIAAVMPPGRAATRVAETAGLKIDELTAGLDKEASGKVDDAISKNERFALLASVLGSQVGGAKTLSQYGDAIKRSALLLMRDGMSEADAVEQATAEITADIDFRSVGQSVVAIPTASNPDMVEAGLSSIVGNFDVTGVDLPPSATGMNEADVKAAYASSIRRNGQWVPDGSGKGVYLYVEGDPVTRGGAPVLFTWDDLKAAGLPKDGFMFEGQR